MFFKKPVCPSCGKRKSIQETQFVVDTIDRLFETEPNWINFFYRGDKKVAYKHFTSCGNWACDSCLTKGEALVANPSKQMFCDYPPYLAYLDSYKVCKSCGKDFVFTKHEKQYWYEVLNFWVQSIAIDCQACRTQKRRRKSIIKNAQERLNDLLPTLDKNDAAQIKEIIDLYMATDSTNKVKEYGDKLRKVIKKNEET